MLSPKILEKLICEDQILEMADFMGEGGRLQSPLVGFGSEGLMDIFMMKEGGGGNFSEGLKIV